MASFHLSALRSRTTQDVFFSQVNRVYGRVLHLGKFRRLSTALIFSLWRTITSLRKRNAHLSSGSEVTDSFFTSPFLSRQPLKRAV